MNNIFIFLAFTCLFLANCRSKKRAQEQSSAIKPVELNAGQGCGYLDELKGREYFLFDSDLEAKKTMEAIMSVTGLPANFVLKAADVDNAIAVVMRDTEPPKRFVLYNQTFFEEIQNKSKTSYGALSILAHEIGHHLSGHTLSEEGSRPLFELEADRFSGYIVRKLGASLIQAQVAINLLCPDEGTKTHPGKKARLAAIANGWKDADEEMNGKMPNVNMDLISKFIANYEISIAPKWALAMRNKVLNARELEIVNSKDPAVRQMLDGETLIAALKPGHKIKLLGSQDKFYKIQTIFNGTIKEGFIAKNVYGESTIVKVN
jgi:hypothetical protein